MQDKPQDIVSHYFSVLEERENYGMAMPLSMLRFTKGEIKDALKSAMLSAESVEEREKLKKGYITLSEFIPDEVLKKVDQDWKNVADAECESGEEPEFASESDIMAEVTKVQKGIADDGAQLAQDIEAFLHKNT
jgi:hypothetical protein